MAIDKITSAAITDGTITSSDLASGAVQNQSAFKNIIINGDMNIAQRGTSKTGITASSPTSQYPTVDRMQFQYDDAGTWTVTQDSTVPTGQGFAKSTKLDCTTAKGTLDADSFLIYAQQIEGQNLQYLKKGTSSAESLTLSFWVRSNKTGTYIVLIYDHDNSRQISKSYTISSADTWEKKTITFAGDTTGSLDNDNAASFELDFWLAAGTNFTSGTLQTSWGTNTAANRAVGQVNLADSTSNEWYITGVQLEIGTSASDFEFLPFDVNLKRCQRYFQHHLRNPNEAYTGGFRSASSTQMGIQFFTRMRSNPTATYKGIRCHDLNDGNNLDASSISFGGVSGDYRDSVWCIMNCASGGSSGDVAIMHGQDTEGTGILGFYMDSEL